MPKVNYCIIKIGQSKLFTSSRYKALNNRSKVQRLNKNKTKMSTKEKQTTSINVRLTKSDAKELQKRAAKEFLSVSAYVRRLSLLKQD